MDLDELGRKIFSFTMVFSVLITVMVSALVAGGFPASSLSLPLFLPASRFYSIVQDMASKIPQRADVITMVTMSTVAFLGGFTQFAFTMLFGILSIVYMIASILPPEVSFLSVPLFFIGSFLQVVVWYYIVFTFFSWLKSWLPGR